MQRFILSLLALSSSAFADVAFTFPAAGDSIPAGTLTVKWEESGSQPSISSLQSYTLILMVGGNDPTVAQPLVNLDTGPGLFSKGNTATGTIDPGIAQTLNNGFYLQMISTSKDGGTITDYSSRFTITGMTGLTDPKYVAQIAALGGITTGPPTVNNVVPKPANPAAAVPSANPNLAGVDIPYNQREGPTRYAPMQPIPPTKISAHKAKARPLYPASPFTIARSKLPPARVETTVTAVQTFKVLSVENTIAAASNPSNNLRF